jgi:hypothetical protein
MSDIVAWECGSCEKTNENMACRHCLICGEQHPVCYYIVGGPIESEIGRRWYGRSAEPIDANDDNVDGDDDDDKHDNNNDDCDVNLNDSRGDDDDVREIVGGHVANHFDNGEEEYGFATSISFLCTSRQY